jgi:hypothetical protein
VREKQEYISLKEKSSKHTNKNKSVNWADKKKGSSYTTETLTTNLHSKPDFLNKYDIQYEHM